MTLSERVMLDTNILVYAYYRKSPHHAASRALLEQVREGTALVATMLGHGITRLYTYNRKDFAPFPVISLLPPSPSA